MLMLRSFLIGSGYVNGDALSNMQVAVRRCSPAALRYSRSRRPDHTELFGAWVRFEQSFGFQVPYSAAWISRPPVDSETSASLRTATLTDMPK
jgi:hypothetical protein